MLTYKTTEEKAAEWDITPRHVQHLCKNGKIDGAVKRAGAWFIPDDTPAPTKNTKSDSTDFRFVGTKSKIFESAISLFKERGFNNVSLKDIAGRIGIRQSTIYNHFKSKQEILDTIYDYYQHYYVKGRPSKEDMDEALHNKSIEDIIESLRYEFDPEYIENLSNITKIVFQRISVDERARELSKALVINEGIDFVEEVFKRGIEIKRFEPFDTHALAVLINGVRVFMMYNWILDSSPENMKKMQYDEQLLYKKAAALITDCKNRDSIVSM